MSKIRNILDEFALKFSKIIKKYTEYIIVSGFVAISSGRTRATEDIDMIIEKLDKEKFILLHEDLVKTGFECMQSANPEIIFNDYLNREVSVRYTRKDEFLPEMEVKRWRSRCLKSGLWIFLSEIF